MCLELFVLLVTSVFICFQQLSRVTVESFAIPQGIASKLFSFSIAVEEVVFFNGMDNLLDVHLGSVRAQWELNFLVDLFQVSRYPCLRPKSLTSPFSTFALYSFWTTRQASSDCPVRRDFVASASSASSDDTSAKAKLARGSSSSILWFSFGCD
jgi:hypothetical protein